MQLPRRKSAQDPLRGLTLVRGGKRFPGLAPSGKGKGLNLGVGQDCRRGWQGWCNELGREWSRRQGCRGVVGNWDQNGNKLGWTEQGAAWDGMWRMGLHAKRGVGNEAGFGVRTQMSVTVVRNGPFRGGDGQQMSQGWLTCELG